jgi:hypothetical protein
MKGAMPFSFMNAFSSEWWRMGADTGLMHKKITLKD